MTNHDKSGQIKMTCATRASVIGGIGISLLLAACSGAPAAGDAIDGAAADPESLGVTSAAITGLHPLGALADDDATLAARLVVQAPPSSPLPTSVDLSADVPPTGDQGAQGSCVAWAAGYATHSYLQHQEEGWPITDTHYQFSPAYIYNQVNNGTDGGTSVGKALDLLVSQGADTLRFSPYSDADFLSQPDSSSRARAAHFKLADWNTLSTAVTPIKQVLAGGRPVIARFEVLPDFDAINSTTNTVYNTDQGTRPAPFNPPCNAAPCSRGGHAVALIGYDDAKQAFHFRNSWGTGFGTNGDAWLAYSFITNSNLHFAAYAATDAPDAAPAVGRNIYIIKNSQLWRIDRNFGNFVGLGGTADWVGAGALTNYNANLYVIQGPRLWRVNPADGSFVTVGGPDWDGTSQLAAVDPYLYGLQDGRLWRIDPDSGAFKHLGAATWTTPTSMTAYNGSLYIVNNSRLFQVNPEDGTSVQLGGADWSGATQITSSGSSLYIVQASALWTVDPTTGAFSRLGTATWPSTTSMTSLSGRLLIVSNKLLNSVDPASGFSEVLNQPSWGGSTLMTIIPR